MRKQITNKKIIIGIVLAVVVIAVTVSAIALTYKPTEFQNSQTFAVLPTQTPTNQIIKGSQISITGTNTGDGTTEIYYSISAIPTPNFALANVTINGINVHIADNLITKSTSGSGNWNGEASIAYVMEPSQNYEITLTFNDGQTAELYTTAPATAPTTTAPSTTFPQILKVEFNTASQTGTEKDITIVTTIPDYDTAIIVINGNTTINYPLCENPNYMALGINWQSGITYNFQISYWQIGTSAENNQTLTYTATAP